MLHSDAYSISTERVEVGLSAIVGVTAVAGQLGLKFAPSGGTLIVSGVTTAAHANGYRWRTGDQEVHPVRGLFFFAATGATCTVDIMRYLSSQPIP